LSSSCSQVSTPEGGIGWACPFRWNNNLCWRGIGHQWILWRLGLGIIWYYLHEFLNLLCVQLDSRIRNSCCEHLIGCFWGVLRQRCNKFDLNYCSKCQAILRNRDQTLADLNLGCFPQYLHSWIRLSLSFQGYSARM
jgi:hypothetical protein